jgi:stage II sporulation protein D
MKLKEAWPTWDYRCEAWINQLIIEYLLLIFLMANLTVLRQTCPSYLHSRVSFLAFDTLCRRAANRSRLLLKIALSVIFLFIMTIQPGCEPRELARPTPQMDAVQSYWVRVLLLSNIENCSFKTTAIFNVTNMDTGSPASTVETGTAASEYSKIAVSAGTITIAGRPFTGGKLIIYPGEPHIFSMNGNEYRGKLELIVNPDGNAFDVINLVPLEPYLAGVIGAEMPDYWEPEALKAQAITARTYCLYIKNRFGTKRNWDVAKTQSNQVYLGIKAESAPVWKAVNDTYGRVLTCKYPDGTEDIFPTYYSSVCGGHTENSKHVFGDSFEPLAGVECPYCKDVAKISLFFWPMAKFDKDIVTKRLLEKYPQLKQLGEITNIVPEEQSDYETFSRITKIKLTGSTGKSDFLRAEDLRLTIDPTGRQIQSTACRIYKWDDEWAFLAGRGWGHGVGMCQNGAEGMARQGKNVEQILAHYYPGSQVRKIY